jgi:hypothetical protein
MEERIAKIVKTRLGYEDHGILTAWLDLDYGGAGQGAGGSALDGPYEDGKRQPNAECGRFIAGVIGACGVANWEDVKGRTVIALCDDLVRGIKPLPTEPGTPFMFEED